MDQVSTESQGCVTLEDMAKDPKDSKFPERVLLLLAEGWTSRIDGARDRHESRLDLIREAIDRELRRRDRLASRATPSSAQTSDDD